MKNFILFVILLFSISFSGNSQVLKTTSLDLNVGGVIHDVEYVPFLNIYVVVGKFTSINGFSRINMAYIDGTTFTVKNSGIGFNPISSVKGANHVFRSVEYYDSGTEHILVVGGAFDTINNVGKSCMFTMNRPYGPVATSFFNHVNFNYDLLLGDEVFNGSEDPTDETQARGVYDLKFTGDTLLIAGSFYGINLLSEPSLTPNWVLEDGLIMLKMSSNTSNISQFTSISTSAVCLQGISSPSGCNASSYRKFAYSILTKSNAFFIGGGFRQTDLYFKKVNLPSITQDVAFNYNYPTGFDMNLIHGLFSVNDTVVIGGGIYDTPTSPVNNKLMFFRTKTPFYNLGGSLQDNHPLMQLNNNGHPNFGSVDGTLRSLMSDGWNVYNGDVLVYYSGNNPKQLIRYNFNTTANSINLTQIGATHTINATATVSGSDTLNNLVVQNQYLFVSEKGLTQADGQTRTGFAIFCLEPTNPSAFVAPDQTVCQGDTVIYSIPDVQSETGYKWTYSGTGIEYSVNGAAFVPYTVPVMNTTAGASSIKIRFLSNATSGTLTVEPYNTCNTTTDYLYAKPQTVAITVNPNPVLGLTATSTEFTCIVDSIAIVGTSSIPTVNYQWAYTNPANILVGETIDSLLINGVGTAPILYPDGTYYVTITEPTTGCSAKGNIVISENTVPPVIDTSSLTITPSLFTCSNTQMNLYAEVSGSSIYWTTQADTSIHFANPHTIYPYDSLSFWAFAVDSVNGCKAQQEYLVQFDYSPVDGYLPDYPTFPADVIVDTINCFTDSINITCAILPSDPNAAYGSISWILNGQADLSVTVADSVGMFLNTKTYQFVTLNSQTGCSDTSDVTIYFDLTTPFVATYNGPHAINCSVDTLTMVHLQTGGNMSEGWLDGLGNQTGSNGVFVNGIGTYIYAITDTINGCFNADTVTVIQTSEMFLTGTPDTVVCDGSQVTVSVNPVNISETVTYLWSNGATGNSTTLIGGTDSIVSVIATTGSGCIGYDTIRVEITDPIQINTAGFMACGSGSGSLQVTDISGGAGSYQYSIDGVNYSSSFLFDSLSPGDYTIFVQDALGCLYTFDETLDASATGPEMNFLVSTYSELSDTLVVVNNSIYQGFDSVQWVFPPNVNVIYLSDSVALIQAVDTGWVSITLIGFEDTCQYSLSKSIYTGESAPVYPTSASSVNIQSIGAYPNPTSGLFTVDVVFGIEQNYAIVVANELGQLIDGMTASGRAISFSTQLDFPLGLEPGAYHIYVLSDYDSRELTIILN